MRRMAPPLFLFLLLSCAPAAPAGPDLILTGGRIYPAADGQEIHGALAIEGDRVVAIGGDPEILALAGDDTQEMTLEEATVLPGFTDSWVDVEALGRWQEGLDLREVATPREVQVRLRTHLAATPAGAMIGWGWDETRWPRPEMPGGEALDEVTSERPVLLYRRIGRLGWINAAAARLIGAESGGVIAEPDLGRLEAALPAPSADERREWLAAGLRGVAAAGITRVATAPLDAQAVRLLAELARREGLPVRAEIRLDPSAPADLREVDGAPLLTVRGIGFVLDGSFGTRDAALAVPYADAEGSGTMDAGGLDGACDLARASGLPLDVMAHGDAAVAAALGCPAVIDGGLIVGGDLLPEMPLPEGFRLAAIPLRLQHDMYWLADRLGEERLARSHRYRDLAASGQLAGLASGAPAYPAGPLAALRYVFTRRDPTGYPIDGWQPGQRLSVADGLRAALRPLSGGDPVRLTEGGVADLVIWSHDPFDEPEVSLGRAQPMVTIVDGRVTYSRPLVIPDFSTPQ